MATLKSRAEYLLENYDDVITGMMHQMDRYAQQSGGYINRMHPDQYDAEGRRKDDLLTEQRRFVRRQSPRR
jgi:hypothetical protein